MWYRKQCMIPSCWNYNNLLQVKNIGLCLSFYLGNNITRTLTSSTCILSEHTFLPYISHSVMKLGEKMGFQKCPCLRESLCSVVNAAKKDGIFITKLENCVYFPHIFHVMDSHPHGVTCLISQHFQCLTSQPQCVCDELWDLPHAPVCMFFMECYIHTTGPTAVITGPTAVTCLEKTLYADLRQLLVIPSIGTEYIKTCYVLLM